jgi:hypothetical protein
MPIIHGARSDDWQRHTAVINAAEIEIACRKEDLCGGIYALPDHIKQMATGALRKRKRHVVI